jgi:gliding motility-associated protein GldL
MSFLKSKGFKYIKNLIIGAGASVVLLGALFKILSWPYANEMLMAGMFTEAGIFLLLGLIPPEKDYYWEKLYPGLDNYSASVQPLAAGVTPVK